MTTNFLLTAVVALSVGASDVLAQNHPSAMFAPTASYYAADVGDLESRIFKLEEDMKKKQDAVDTKRRFSVDVSGRVFMDAVNFSPNYGAVAPTTGTNNPNPNGGVSDYIGLRDARIGVGGRGYEVLDYRAELSYERGALRMTDVFMGVRKVPGLDYVRVGHYKVETGMSYMTSGRNSTAMERAASVGTFSPGRRLGISQIYLFGNDQVRWFNGVFLARDISGGMFHSPTATHENNGTTRVANDMNMSNRGTIFNSRFSMVPYYAKDGERFFHLGGHYMYREKDDKGFAGNMSTSTAIGGFSRAGNAGWLSTQTAAWNYNQGGIELAWGRDRLAISSELFAGSFGNGRDMYGGYAEVRYFLTKDSRPYSKSSGTPGNVKMRNNFLTGDDVVQTLCHGRAKVFGIQSIGAWEVYAQWSFVDSDRVAFFDGPTGPSRGGRAVDTAFGLNWYWNPNTRMMFEYVHSNRTQQAATGYPISSGTGNDSYRRASVDTFATSLRFSF